MEPLLIINLTQGPARLRELRAAVDVPLRTTVIILAPVWVISSSPFITFIVAVMKRSACLHKALTGPCLFNTSLSHWQACTNLIYPWVTVANITPSRSTHPQTIITLIANIKHTSHEKHITYMNTCAQNYSMLYASATAAPRDTSISSAANSTATCRYLTTATTNVFVSVHSSLFVLVTKYLTLSLKVFAQKSSE